jgi:hypothetical protein
MVLELGFMRRDLISNTIYSYWSYVMINFFKGKRMRGYVNGIFVKPRNTNEGYAALINA